MTRKKAENQGWKIGRVMTGGYYGRKGNKMCAATTLKSLLSKIAKQ
jgi:hypothetical protein